MKRILLVIISCIFLSLVFISCQTTRAQQGAILGGYSGALGSVIGKGDRTTTAIIGGAGAVLGYIIGNEFDKVDTRNQIYNQSYNNQRYNTNQSYNPTTECRKVTKRSYQNGQVIETIEEICEGRRVTNTY